MKILIHPTFQKTLQKRFISIWLTAAISFSSGLYLSKTGHQIIAGVLFGVMGISIFGGLAYLFYQHYHVTCLECNGKTKTTKDSTKTKWVAHCERCQIEWDLNTGVGPH
jgi:hypothetical protein